MKIKIMLLLAILIVSLVPATTLAQTAPKKDTINVGSVSGLLRDSVHNYVMPSATLAIYKVKDNELVSYQLSNNYGKYQFKLMPVGIPLRLVVTHIGYQSGKAEFTISPKTKTIELKTINLERIDQSLKEVVISAAQAPMQMRGDTLEFNASAFKLDTNAVIEDLLRKLPGVTVWGDGVITVNGKTISRLLVDGKDFFNGDNKIALQNIPKNSVQKIQVYQNKEDKDPITPKTDMNIVLKKDKKDGFFGKFGLGGGTQDHYAADGMITYFSPKTQVAVVGAYNNVNKTAYNVNTLMGFNSFKGEGINNDYHSDFTRQGKNVFKGGGFTASQDFSKDNDTRQAYYKTNMLKGEFFVNDNNNNTERQSLTQVLLGTGTLNQTSSSSSISDDYSHRANANYNKRYQHGALNGAVNLVTNSNTSMNTDNSNSVNQQTGETSTNMQQRNSSSSSTNINGEVGFSTDRYYDFGKQKMKSFGLEMTYRFELNDGDNDNTTINDFKATDVSKNKYINRHYLKDITGSKHSLYTNFRDIIGLTQRSSPKVQVDIRNNIEIRDSKENNNVSDLALAGAAYTPNTALTNITHLKIIDERPALTFSKSFYKSLDNRFQKSWYLQAAAEGQIYLQRNTALQTFQNLDRSYHYFIPSASINYYNYQYGDNTQNYSLRYSTSVDYPQIWQLAPLYDDINSYAIPVGNLSLKPSVNQALSFNYDYGDLATKNPFKSRLNLSAGIVKNSFSDSTNYDALGRYTRATINLGDRKYFNLSSSIEKTFKLKEHQFAFSTGPGGSLNRYLVSINGQHYETFQRSLNMSAVLIYTYKSTWSAGFGEYFNGNKTDQGTLSHSTYYNWTTNFGFAFAFPRSVFFNTRINFNNTKSSGQKDNVYFTIWNADMGYRFLKGSNAEIKLSALDILHQNRSIYNSVYNNTITTSTANVLQQYFMLTLAYYPRKFGLKK